jgi:hypothetical protein
VAAGLLGVVAAVSEAVSIHYGEVADDPPRGDYTKRAVFEPVSLPAPAGADPLPSLLHEMATAILNEASALDALRITIERLQGADKAAPNIGDDVRYVQRQAKTGMDLAEVVREQIARQKELRPQLQAEWANAAPAVSVVIPADYASTVNAQLDQARATLVDNGISLPASRVNALKKAVRDELDPAVGTTRKLSTTFPTVSGLTTTNQRMKSLEKDLGEVFATIEST